VENSALLVISLLPDLCVWFCPSCLFSLVDNPDCSVFWGSNLGIRSAGLVSKDRHELPAMPLLMLSHVSAPGDHSVGKQEAEL